MDDRLKDMSLFAWNPPKQVLLFPLVRRVGKVRHTARHLSAKHGEEASLYWKQVVSANRKHLKRVGLSPDEVESEIQSFFDAVQRELVRLSYAGKNTGGAA